MKNNILEKNHDKCTSCGICEAVCPKEAIKLYLSDEGFYQPKVDEKKCISCGICKQTCIKFQKVENREINIKVYSAKNKNKDILKKSSSGGVSYELMKKCIEEGYKVVGVIYDYEEDIAITKIIDDKINLNQFFGSKYMQSYTVEALKEIIKNSKEKFAIFGTPCQIFSLFKYAEKRKVRDNFLFVDLFCHGCPSLNLWKKYLESQKRMCEVDKFDEIEFRSKCHGWHEYGYKFYYKENIKISDISKNEFNEIFFDNNVFNRACYECKIRADFNYCDIRLGDFWGKTYDGDLEGVSAVVLSTQKGKEIFSSIHGKFALKEHFLDEILIAQSCSNKHIENKKLREVILELLKTDLSLEEIIKKYRKSYSLKKKLKKKIIEILKRNLSQNSINKIRKIIHK